MKIIYSEDHKWHAPKLEFSYGQLNNFFEIPERAEKVMEALKEIGPILPPASFPKSAITAVHEENYVAFLQTAYRQWAAAGLPGNAIGSVFNKYHTAVKPPQNIDGLCGYYTADGTVPITETSWKAIEAAAFVALTAQKCITEGDNAAFALCRPPGHHAGKASAAGYCFLNNAALAAAGFLQGGAKKVAILDIDYHHGNGTQEIFYDRSDVLYVSIHADPAYEYPYFAGYAKEKGEGQGEGFNVNYPLPIGTAFAKWKEVLEEALRRVAKFNPDILLVSLGLDTFKKDPIGKFKLAGEDFITVGQRLASLKKPTLFVMEGGYAVEELGQNVRNVLKGFE